jgi:glycosyltransferase involved in cell wall biosynthesis
MLRDKLDRILLSVYDLRLHLRMANRIRRRGPGLTGLFSKRTDRPQRPETLGMLAIMKNEAHLIEEWLDHYLWQGAGKIYLIDNGSTDGTLSRVHRYVASGRVHVVEYSEQHKQVQHYWNAFQHFQIARHCEWLGIADIDEFWFCKSGQSLKDYLSSQHDKDAVYANWTNFGTDLEGQPDSVRQSLCQMNPRKDRFTKYFFRTSLPEKQEDIEVHSIRNVGFLRARIANRDLQLNHYVTQSRHFWFEIKMRRGDVFYTGQSMDALRERYDRVNRDSTATCTRLRDLVDSEARL